MQWMLSTDYRGHIILGLFALGFFELALMVAVPALRSDDLFKMIAQATFISGLVLITNYYFGSSQGSAQKSVTIQTELDKKP